TAGAFIAWILGSLSAHFIAGLSLEVSFIIGGLFVVTGPTVIIPLLRNAKLHPRVAAVLKWEGIIVDPAGPRSQEHTSELQSRCLPTRRSSDLYCWCVYCMDSWLTFGSFYSWAKFRSLFHYWWFICGDRTYCYYTIAPKCKTAPTCRSSIEMGRNYC